MSVHLGTLPLPFLVSVCLYTYTSDFSLFYRFAVVKPLIYYGKSGVSDPVVITKYLCGGTVITYNSFDPN